MGTGNKRIYLPSVNVVIGLLYTQFFEYSGKLSAQSELELK
ncbi:hypothetical protein COO91_05956 [Nostoc flagelliforme CCNUN1]|uniref:Uncharacterized protein n=1 Tax=Nostoc flagelliforme CCNUN1 TaxID=2038116 RepID=A0A2K8SX64_9NOSO|nr:hypothetical protein COO91_05956 [Nostoc flagelliforme CCNUN1]